jgi:hypothetical protein
MSPGTTFSGLVQAFFTDRLLRQRGASPHTVAGYRDTLRYYSVKLLRTIRGLCSYDQYEQDLHARTQP